MGYPAYSYLQHPASLEMPPEPSYPQHNGLGRQPGHNSAHYQMNSYLVHRSNKDEMHSSLVVPAGQRYPRTPAMYRQQPYQHSTVYSEYLESHAAQAYGTPSPASSYTEIPPPNYDECVRPHSGRSQYLAGRPSPSRSSPPGSSSSLPGRAPSPPFTGKLAKPVAIPATQASLGSPFLRAYPPVLSHFDISRDTFLQFLDGLNRAAVASPPLQVLGLAGNIVSMVPLHTTQIVGGALNGTAMIGTVAVSKGRVEMTLRQANKEIFAPKGLNVQIAKLDALAVMAKMPILGADGKVDKNVPILKSIANGVDNPNMPAQHRRIRALEPWLERLEVVDLPAVEQSANLLGKMHAFASERQRKKEEEKLSKDRAKHEKDWKKDGKKAEREYDQKMRHLEREEKMARRRGDEDKLGRIEDKRDRLQEKFEGNMGGCVQGGSKAEEKLMRKIYFLTVTNAATGQAIA
ncbi:hypothetical protein QQS21_002588 [Conoideocrella luteorostrata]|uniref:Uncharacterized protein n=1 Tax=Conoideocrella luteorostrata TaxID=1105319 RepID=A0AAJ0CXR7_9HYPO|nr:hypothetical protein QQS21_002588 [Conoideocrella luteorostrata]